MTKRRKWTAIPGLTALAVGAIALSAYSGASSSQNRAPVQPINFPHTVHVKRLGINCLYCHYAANKSPDPGLPAVSTCMGCHTIITADRPASDLGPKRHSKDIEKLTTYYTSGRPIPWVRIHKVPEYVHFPHMRHINAGVTCQSCHGQIQNMPRVYQYASLNMGWCISCHVNGYSAKEGLQAAGYAPADTGPPGATPAIPASLPTGAGEGSTTVAASGVRKKARYDCASCHY